MPRRLDIRLPDGKAGRVLEAAVSARPEEGVEPSGRKLHVRVARSTARRDATLATFRWRLLVAGLSACAFSAALSLLAAQQGLRVLDALGARFDRLDANRLGEQIPEARLPRELLPPVRKLNELLGRLRASLERERRFNADVSHELRTPLSGMQAILELALSRDRSAADYKDAIVRARAVARDQQRLVESLLALSRAEAGQLEPRREPVSLREVCDLAFAAVSDEAAARGLRFENKVAPEATVTSDPGLLRAIAGNLISNATAYTERGGWISVESDLEKGLWLSVQDSGPPLPAGKAEQIFERFVRLDGARSADGHHGIGLSLVRALCCSLGLTVAAQNQQGGTVAFDVRIDPAKGKAEPAADPFLWGIE
jgi:signal transduction histidine kinase